MRSACRLISERAQHLGREDARKNVQIFAAKMFCQLQCCPAPVESMERDDGFMAHQRTFVLESVGDRIEEILAVDSHRAESALVRQEQELRLAIDRQLDQVVECLERSVA